MVDLKTRIPVKNYYLLFCMVVERFSIPVSCTVKQLSIGVLFVTTSIKEYKTQYTCI